MVKITEKKMCEIKDQYAKNTISVFDFCKVVAVILVNKLHRNC